MVIEFFINTTELSGFNESEIQKYADAVGRAIEAEYPEAAVTVNIDDHEIKPFVHRLDDELKTDLAENCLAIATKVLGGLNG